MNKAMISLNGLQCSDLTDYVVQKLQSDGIETVRDFLATDEDKFCKATNLKKKTFYNIKLELLRKHGPFQARMSCLYLKNMRTPLFNYNTGVPNLDLMLEDNAFCGGCLLEVCGFTGTGKNQLCLTVAINFATYYGEVLYIDTKAECAGSRIYHILKMRNVSKTEIGRIMEKIKIERTFSAVGVINILNGLLGKLENACSSEARNIKLIIIDSLPAVGLHFVDEEQKINRKYWLTCLANLMRKLSTEHLIAFLFVNILIRVEINLGNEKDVLGDDGEQFGYEDSDIDSRDSQHSEPTINIAVRPALGKYWLSVPTIRLSMEKKREQSFSCSNEESNIRIVKVLKSCYTRSGDTCLVRITKSGVL